jgi:hypothetical protein
VDRLSNQGNTEDLANHRGLAIAELIAYIDDIRSNADIAPVFLLSDLNKLFTQRLQKLKGNSSLGSQNATRLKEKLMEYFPDMIAVSCLMARV